MPNQLKNEKSPYLKQHENNPVDWFAWNKETLKKAKNQEKPIFLRYRENGIQSIYLVLKSPLRKEKEKRYEKVIDLNLPKISSFFYS